MIQALWLHLLPLTIMATNALTNLFICRLPPAVRTPPAPPGRLCNMAGGQPVAQSSDGAWWSVAGRAVDMRYRQDLHGACAHTNFERNPWW